MVPGKPWLRIDNNYFMNMFMYLHLYWLTEKNGMLQFELDPNVNVAKWNTLRLLYSLEKDGLVNLSKLNDLAISPNLIDTCLRFFVMKLAAIETHPGINTELVMGTVNFLKLIIKFQKIVMSMV